MLLQTSIWRSSVLSFEEKTILAFLAKRPMAVKQIFDVIKRMGDVAGKDIPAVFNSLNHKELIEIHHFELKKGRLIPYFTVACDWGVKL
jgi:hypothetical protein